MASAKTRHGATHVVCQGSVNIETAVLYKDAMLIAFRVTLHHELERPKGTLDHASLPINNEEDPDLVSQNKNPNPKIANTMGGALLLRGFLFPLSPHRGRSEAIPNGWLSLMLPRELYLFEPVKLLKLDLD